VTSTKNRARRLIVVGAFAVAAVAAPFAASALTSDAPETVALPPGCLAWFGNAEDGHCLGYSNGNPIVGSTPSTAFGPNYYGRGGPNLSTGPLIPGRTITSPVA
jgi:hypothetical protein